MIVLKPKPHFSGMNLRPQVATEGLCFDRRYYNWNIKLSGVRTSCGLACAPLMNARMSALISLPRCSTIKLGPLNWKSDLGIGMLLTDATRPLLTSCSK
jgi:hypothetical protein